MPTEKKSKKTKTAKAAKTTKTAKKTKKAKTTTKKKTKKTRRARAKKKTIDRPGDRDLSAPLGEAKAMVLERLSTARPYHWKNSYEVGDAIDHPSFGFGEVRRIISSKKIEVSFGDRTCLLAQTNTPSTELAV